MWTGLGRYYRKLDEGNGQLNKYDLEKGLIDFHIELPQEVSKVQISTHAFKCPDKDTTVSHK